MSSALFGASTQARSKNLVEFKAGKMLLQGKLVKPDKRKGLIYVYQSDDSIMHFCWKDRNTGIVEEDLMIFPDDIEYKRITQCTTGRVFLMKFKSTNRKLFFWMQEPESDKDEKLWKKLNDYLNNPPPPGSLSAASMSGERGSSSSSAAGLASAFGADFGGTDLQSLLGSMNEQQIQQLLGMSGYIPVNSPTSNRSVSSNASSNQNSRAQSTTSNSRANASATPTITAAPTTTTNTTATTTTTASGATSTTTTDAKVATTESQKIQLSDLQNILGTLSTGEQQRTSVDLSEIVSADIMAPILSNKQVQEKLIKYLPEGDVLPKNEEELKNTFTTPQFKRAMSSFGEALQSGQLGPLLSQFNLPTDVMNAAAQGNLEEFAKAMEKHSKKSKDEKDEKMDT